MGRRSGRDISGWLVVDKPAGITSTAVVGRVRWALDARKAGHAGTLDPDATGVLAVALGEATKTVPYLTEALKAYDFTVIWGSETDTDDASGQVTARADPRPDAAAIAAALPALTGEIRQVPPAYSAVKVDGARAYDLARAGQPPDLAPRPLLVQSLRLIAAEPTQARLEMVCGKGGYVRAIARDLGRALGCLGHVGSLRRIWSGPFRAETAVDYAAIDRGDPALQARLLPLQAALDGLPHLHATPEGAIRIRNGNPGDVATGADYGATVWVSAGGRPLCIGRYLAGQVQPDRVFNL